MLTQILAAAGLTACILLGVHMALPTRWQARVNRSLGRLTRGASRRFTEWLDDVRGWRQRRLSERAALEEANELIRRAREASRKPDGEWDGNVYHAKDFQKKPDRRNLH